MNHLSSPGVMESASNCTWLIWTSKGGLKYSALGKLQPTNARVATWCRAAALWCLFIFFSMMTRESCPGAGDKLLIGYQGSAHRRPSFNQADISGGHEGQK